jgi:putative hydrolase of the HAD superfamily
MIELFIFDMGGVVCRDFDIVPAAAARLGMPAEEFRIRAAPAMPAFMRGEIDAEEFWWRFEAATDIRPGEDYWTTLFSPTVDEPTERLIRELKDGGPVRVVCGTNTIDAHYRIHRGLGQYDCFDWVYASHLMGSAKPDPEFWLRILREEGTDPERAFFVDDNPENVDAAKALGIESRLYVSAAALRRDLLAIGVLGDRRGTGLDQP